MDDAAYTSESVTNRRVLLLITHLGPGGAQETVLLLARGLGKLGYDVTVAARGGGSEEHRLDGSGTTVVPLRHLARAVSPVRDALAYREIALLLRTRRYDVIHTHSSKAGVLGRPAARRAGVPAIVHTSHGLPVNPDMGRLERAVLLAAERFAAHRCDRVVAVSSATAREILELQLATPEQIAVIPSGVHVDLLAAADPVAARKLLNLPAGAPVVGWVGRYFPQKRPDEVVAAARAICRSVPDAHVVLVGDGPLLDQSRAAAYDQPRIHVLGYRDDVAALYAAMDVMILASAWEGLPRTVLEALAAGVPVVSTDISGISEVVTDGDNGWLVAPGDWQGLAAKTIRLLTDPDLRARMSQAAARCIRAKYSAEHTVAATDALYREMLSRAARSSH